MAQPPMKRRLLFSGSSVGGSAVRSYEKGQGWSFTGIKGDAYRFPDCPDDGLDGAAVLSPLLDLRKIHRITNLIQLLRGANYRRT